MGLVVGTADSAVESDTRSGRARRGLERALRVLGCWGAWGAWTPVRRATLWAICVSGRYRKSHVKYRFFHALCNRLALIDF